MSSEARQIVIPVDFGEQSLIALGQSYNLAKLTRSEITLLHVIDQDFLAAFVKHSNEDHHTEEVKERLDALAKKVHAETGIKVNTLIRTGKIYDEIVDASDEMGASLIVMGTMGAIGLKKRIMGSNASRVVRESVCPVITIKGKKHRFGIKHILLPLDLTKETKEKVDKAIELAQMYGATIHILTIVESDDEFLMNKLIRQMNQVTEFIEEAGLKCTSEFLHSKHVAEEVIQTATKIEADLIMIMTQQEVGFTDLFISSAAQEIINNSEIPVLSIRPFPKKDTTVSVLS